MPYIGNNHIAGDHTNNFKVLDDISSFTATFDGSATSVVDTTNNTIRVVEHRFIQGQRVTYTNGGGGNIGGLTTGTAYFVIFDSASTIKLATSASNAASSTAINLSAVGSGSSHTLNAAFDGVNTKFKLTHGSGTGARLNNATQINVAINNVLQRPNLDPNNFTDGFALEDNHKIVFQTAPTSEDIFWGSIIANTLTTFDISDHKIDTFTGDGSTTEFNLSHTPANNESLMVTINGVLQHPSNASTARAYTLIANVIQFTAAPGVGDEIQIRHMGFAGATTADVSGFYGRTGNVVLTDQDDITVNKINVGTGVTIESNGQATFVGVVTFGSGSTTIDNNVVNVGTALTLGHTQGLQFHTQNLHSAGFEINQINASGIITASSLDISGNASIGGVLTYEDVTSIDSVGIITARNGIDCNGDIDVDGHTNLDNVSISGVVTATSFVGALPITGDTNNRVITATGSGGLNGEANLTFSGSVLGLNQPSVDSNYVLDANGGAIFTKAGTFTSNDFNKGHLTLRNTTASQGAFLDLRAASSGGALGVIAKIGGFNTYSGMGYDGALTFSTRQNSTNTMVERLRINSSGNVSIVKDLDVDGHTNLDNVSIAGVTTMSGNLTISNTDPRIIFVDTNNNPDFTLHANGGAMQVENSGSGTQVKLESSGSTRLFGNVIANKDLDVDGHTNLDNVSVAGITTFSGRIIGSNSASTVPTAKFTNSGTGNQLELYGSVTSTLLIKATNNNGTPKLQLRDNYNRDNFISVTESGDNLVLAVDEGNAGADSTMRFRVDGDEKVRITSDGRVGINQTAPQAMLQVDYDYNSSEIGLRLRAATGSGTKTWQLSEINGNAGVFTLRNASNGYNILNVDGANQRIGINDTTPERTMDIRGSNCMIQLEGTAGSGRQWSLCSTDNATGTAVDGGPSGSFAIYDDTSGNARLRIDSGGNARFLVSGGSFTAEGTGAYGMSIHNHNSPSMGHLFIFGDNGLIRFRNSSSVYTAQMGYNESTNALFLYNQEGGTYLSIIDDGVKISDNEKFLCGNDQDLEIYHNNSNAFIKNGTGQLLYRSSQHVFENAAGSVENLRIKSDGRVSINDGSPSSAETLTIRPLGNVACDVSLKMNHSTDSRIKFYDDNGVWRGAFGFTNYANNTTYPNFHDSFYMMTDPSSNGTLATVMRINREGAFMYPKQPCFSVAMSNNYTTSTSHTANFDTLRFDQGDNFNTGSNGIFTAPVTGKYYMHAAIQTQAGGTASQVHIMGVGFTVNGSIQESKGSGDQYLGRNDAYYITVHAIRILNLAQGDTVQVYILLHGSVAIEGSGGLDRCNWQGYLMA